MLHKKMELECDYFTSSRFSGNNLGFNPEPGRVYPEKARIMKRRPTLNAPSNLSPESLTATVKSISELLNNNQAYITIILNTYGNMGINSNRDLYVALHNTRDSKKLAKAFEKQFEEVSGGLTLCHKQGPFYRCALI